MNRHRKNDMQEVWDSFEYSFRERLEYLDYMTRSMIREMQMSGANMTQIGEFVPKQFERVWYQVAQEQEAQNGRKMKHA